jgi:hypothetical protein
MEPVPVTQIPCPFCSTLVDASAFFCPTCGKNLRVKPLSTGIATQIGLYAVSVLLPPLFLFWTMKYLKSTDPKAKQIGMISLGLTIAALIIAIWLSIAFTKSLTQDINQQFNQYQDLGL